LPGFVLDDPSTNNFSDLWYYSISESGKAVQSIGNPISHSTH
tara:strand:- start:1482 stop:1607 length:126 start_codon:yes stop_codon:yes gene_type:complete